jgi:hypothetical protein
LEVHGLNQFQAKESTEIPENIYNMILTEIRKMKITNINKISLKTIRTILKKLHLNIYYEHAPYILCKITRKAPPTLTRQTEEQLKTMFKQIQDPFIRHCPANRVNFLSYSYVLHKFFQILGLTDYLNCFDLLKSREKLRVQEEIWKKICVDLNWPFHPSI